MQPKRLKFSDGVERTITQACAEFGMSRSYFKRAFKTGKACTIDYAHNKPTKGYKIKARDHEGNEFNSFAEMCRYWNVPYMKFYHHLQKYSVEESIEITIREQNVQTLKSALEDAVELTVRERV